MKVIEKRLQMPRKTLVLFQFIIEGYERMATISTLDPHTAIVQIFIMPDFLDEMTEIMDALKNELDFEWIPT
jgi:hypothetical protein